MNRITNCEKWQDTWFSDLSPNAKLVFIFLYENCNNAGIYEINKKFMLFLLGLNEKELKEAIKELKKSYIKSKDDTRIWLKNFLKHQKQLPLNPKNGAHKHIILLLEENTNDPDKFKGCKEMVSLIPVIEDKPKTKKVRRTTKKFKKPTVEEVKAFMEEKQFKLAKVEAERFWNWFESNGWKVGKNPMKNWKGAVNSWMSNWYERNKIEKPKNSRMSNLKESHENLGGVDWNEVYKDENS